ncbi:MAG: hypothetical protein ACE5M4_06990 [Anaerolineales bacterium]
MTERSPAAQLAAVIRPNHACHKQIRADMKPRLIAIAMITASVVLLVTACEGFEHSIEPLDLPTAPPQAFQNFANSESQKIDTIESDSPAQLYPGMESVSAQTLGLDLATSVLPLAGAGALGVILATVLTFAKLDFVKTEGICIGAIVAGLLGFFALVPFDYAAAVSSAALGATGPVGVALDLFIILPLELIVIDLHIGFISLAFHALSRSCANLEPKKYFLPPWGFGG